MRSVSGATISGGCRMMTNRHKRHSASQCVTSSGQKYRHQRHTPLGGVTLVTLAGVEARLAGVPTTMPLNVEAKPCASLSAHPPCGLPAPATAWETEEQHSPLRRDRAGPALGDCVGTNVVGCRRYHRTPVRALAKKQPNRQLSIALLGGTKKRKKVNEKNRTET